MLCENNCGIQIPTEGRRFTKIRGDKEHVAPPATPATRPCVRTTTPCYAPSAPDTAPTTSPRRRPAKFVDAHLTGGHTTGGFTRAEAVPRRPAR
ncbi:hypothetical protein [Streptomyces sp. MN13]